MKQLYQADGIASAVDFHFHPAIRTIGDPKMDHNFSCPDEDSGCPLTKFIVCAFAYTTDAEEQVGFLSCWDESRGEPVARAENCSRHARLDWHSISSCASGSQAAQLQQQAAQYFEEQNPEYAHNSSSGFNIPHFVIGGRNYFNTQYTYLLKALCSTGIEARACQTLVVV